MRSPLPARNIVIGGSRDADTKESIVIPIGRADSSMGGDDTRRMIAESVAEELLIDVQHCTASMLSCFRHSLTSCDNPIRVLHTPRMVMDATATSGPTYPPAFSAKPTFAPTT